MDLTELRALIDEGESETLEFKRSTGELRAGMETLCAFLNGQGGRVLVGVSNSGRIQGQQFADSTLRDVASAIGRLEPSARIHQERIPVRGDLEVLVLEARRSDDGPYTYDGRPYERVGPTTQRMAPAEYEQRLLARLQSQHRWENRIAEGYSLRDLDMAEIRRTLESAVEAGRLESVMTSTREALDRLGLRINGRIAQAAMVAFGKRLLPDYPQCSLRLARFRGTTKTEFVDQRQMEGHAFLLLREADLFIRRHLPVAGRIQPGIFDREDQPIFPPLALREALVNALCHRDYSIPGGAVSVGIFDDRLEITSTGTLPPGITVADLKREHTSRPRNPLLAEVFYRRGLIERWGRGTQKIVELCQAAGHPEPEFEERAGEVVVRLLPSEYIPPHRVSHDLTERQWEILQILGDGERHRFPEVFEKLTDPPTERWVREDMALLRKLGLIDTRGGGHIPAGGSCRANEFEGSRRNTREVRRKSKEVEGSRGKSWEVVGSRGKSWEVVGSRKKPRRKRLNDQPEVDEHEQSFETSHRRNRRRKGSHQTTQRRRDSSRTRSDGRRRSARPSRGRERGTH